MRIFKRLINISLPVFGLIFLSGCAAGAATAGYSLKAQSADSLSTSAEQRIVDRVKREMMAELSPNNQYNLPR